MQDAARGRTNCAIAQRVRWRRSDVGDRAPLRRPRVARDQRSGRLRLRHLSGACHAALSRAAHRRPARAARSGRDAQPPLGGAAGCRTARDSTRRARSDAGGGLDAHGLDHLRSSVSRSGCPSGATSGRLRLEKRIHLRTCQNTVHIRYRLHGEGRCRASSSVRPTVELSARSNAPGGRAAGPDTVDRGRGPATSCAAGASLPPLRLRSRPRRAFTIDGPAVLRMPATRREHRAAATRRTATCASPATSAWISRRTRRATLVASTERGRRWSR